MNDHVFQAQNICKNFGKNPALVDVSLNLRRGEVLGVIGANGAGKSTLMRILAGALKAESGEILLDGKKRQMNSMLEAWEAGIGFVSQELNLFPALSVIENLSLVPGSKHNSNVILEKSARATLDELGLQVSLTAKVETLSLADRQLVEIARALLQKPRVLILDEPTSALHVGEVERLHKVLRDLNKRGVSIIYITHFLEHLLDISNRFAVLRDGKRVKLVTKGDRPTVPELVEAMLSEKPHSADSLPEQKQDGTDGVELRISELTTAKGLNVAEFKATNGEIVGVAGHAGSGPEELFSVLFGRTKSTGGSITLPSGAEHKNNSADAVKSGVAYFPADRKGCGLTLRQSVTENVSAVRALTLGWDGLFPGRRKQTAIATERCRDLGVKLADVSQKVGELSGGNQQKVVFARWLEANPSLLLIDDPMRGVDVNAKKQINSVIQGLMEEPRVILFHSTDPEDYVSVAHRVVVFVDGELSCQLSGPEITEHNLMEAMNGSWNSVSVIPQN
nr:sugar ABC transporter ATP-binding protein [Ruegeria arenilitoris]